MARQTTVTAVPVRGLAGQLSDGFKFPDLEDVVVDQATSIAPGLLILRSSGGDRAGVLPPAAALDDDAIVTSVATSASQQVLSGAGLTGVIGAGRISPPSKIVVTRSSHANQDAVTAVLAGLDENGIPVTENLTFADAGGDTPTSTLYYSRVTSLTIPAQSGTGGTTKVGAGATVSLDGGDVLGISVHTHKGLVSPAEDSNELYEQYMTMPVLKSGRIFVICENAFRAGDIAHVRVAAGTGTQLGAFRAHDTDSSTCVPCKRIRFVNSGQAGDVAELHVRAA